MKHFFTQLPKIAFVLLCCSSAALFASAEMEASLKFRADKTFRIVQFTDIHWDNNIPESCRQVEDLMLSVLSLEKPDLVVFTGDIVTVSPAREGWLALADVMSKSEVSWTAVLGNHDDETDMSRDAIFDLLLTLPGFIGEKGSVSGVGNFVISLQTNSGHENAATLYFLDSHAYTSMRGAGYYDWFRFDQLQWFRNQSAAINATHADVKLPALAFFHIPTPEWNEAWEGNRAVAGVKNEGVSSGVINAGMIAAFLEMGDVMGAFAGHDHVNNYIGQYHGLALAYGQKTGFNSYGDLPKGARVIELTQGERSFKTWIRTSEGESYHYRYPEGVSFREQDHHFLQATQPESAHQGLCFSYYEGPYENTREMMASKAIRSGITDSIAFTEGHAIDSFGYVFTGYIHMPERGLYRLTLTSDDGSVLWLGDDAAIWNDGLHGADPKDKVLAFEAGYHAFKLAYFEQAGDQTLNLSIQQLSSGKTLRSEQLFFYAPSQDGCRNQ